MIAISIQLGVGTDEPQETDQAEHSGGPYRKTTGLLPKTYRQSAREVGMRRSNRLPLRS